jgi:hypothetical protein
MKKILTSVLTLALVLCCFTFVGCTKDEEPKPATIEQTLAILDNFVSDMKAIETKISAQDYVYPTIDAIRASQAVTDTDKSSIGIEYSNYMDFDYDYDFEQGTSPEPYSPSYNFYPDIVEMSFVSVYASIYEENGLKLDTTYTFTIEDDGDTETMFIKLTNDKSKVCFYVAFAGGEENEYHALQLNLNSNSNWVSFEYKVYDEEDFVNYSYVEKSTNENRIFNRYLSVEQENQGIGLIDLDETTQKMLYVDEFTTDSMNLNQSKVYNYLESLNIESISNDIDTTNAIEIEVNLGE